MSCAVRTPAEAVQAPGYALADRDERVLAYVFDLGLAGVALLPVVLHGALVGPESMGRTLASPGWGMALVGALALGVGQWALLTMRGQTLGKMALGLQIVRPDGSLPGFGRAVLVRSWVIGLLSSFCGLIGLVDAAMLLGADRRTLHDRLADTVVVRVGGGR